jgi:hypothetical protein
MRARFLTVLGSVALTVYVGCTTPGPARKRGHNAVPATFATARSGAHIVGHEPGTCDLCDLYYKARTHVVRLRRFSSQVKTRIGASFR